MYLALLSKDIYIIYKQILVIVKRSVNLMNLSFWKFLCSKIDIKELSSIFQVLWYNVKICIRMMCMS